MSEDTRQFAEYDARRHHLSRSLPGVLALNLPLCWDADAIQRHGLDYDTEDWFTAWDHDAIDPTSLVFATAPQYMTCDDCKEWIHA